MFAALYVEKVVRFRVMLVGSAQCSTATFALGLARGRARTLEHITR